MISGTTGTQSTTVLTNMKYAPVARWNTNLQMAGGMTISLSVPTPNPWDCFPCGGKKRKMSWCIIMFPTKTGDLLEFWCTKPQKNELLASWVRLEQWIVVSWLQPMLRSSPKKLWRIPSRLNKRWRKTEIPKGNTMFMMFFLQQTFSFVYPFLLNLMFMSLCLSALAFEIVARLTKVKTQWNKSSFSRCGFQISGYPIHVETKM